MEPSAMVTEGTQQSASDLGFSVRSYQIEAFEKAVRENTIVFLETGSGKTLIAIMLLRHYAYLLRRPSRYNAVFLVPTVVLVGQQAEAIRMHTDLAVGEYWGAMGVDYWDGTMWKLQQDTYAVLVMTPAIFLDALRHSFLALATVKILIFDECHNAKGRHPYACIMTEFYHRQMASNISQLPRIFGMTASPVKCKVSSNEAAYWKEIRALENLMNSKVYTCKSESVLANYSPISTPKLRFYKQVGIPCRLFEHLASELESLAKKYEVSLDGSSLLGSTVKSVRTRFSRLYSTFMFCLSELGVWLAFKAAESLSCVREDMFLWGKLDKCGETFLRDFKVEAIKIFFACIPSGSCWSITRDIEASTNAGYLTTKVVCLLECLLEYRHLEDLRCIIFVERVITAIVLRDLLREFLPTLTGWKTDYTAGYNSDLRPQKRKEQNDIIEAFRKGLVNIIVSSSILEEGLDVQSCNLVIRFDPSLSVCSFIQSRGRARMKNSDFVIMVKSGDSSMLNHVNNCLASGEIMRKESLCHASLPCAPIDSELSREPSYQVESTGAIVTLSSSVVLVYNYCSRLPSDGYFRPYPWFVMNEEVGICTLYFPKSSPLKTVEVEGKPKTLKQLACLEACKKLHQMGALTDNLVPDIVIEEAEAQELSYRLYNNSHAKYFPPELVCQGTSNFSQLYYCYLVKLQGDFYHDILLHDIVLATKARLDFDDEEFAFNLEADKGHLTVNITFVQVLKFTSDQVGLSQRFQMTLSRVLLDHKMDNVKKALDVFCSKTDLAVHYLLLPSSNVFPHQLIDWTCVESVLFPYKNPCDAHSKGSHSNCNGHLVVVKNGVICSCMLENSLVYTPHNDRFYCVTGILKYLDANSLMTDGQLTYKKYFKRRHDINLSFEREKLLRSHQIFPVRNCLLQCRQQKGRDPSSGFVELPPELCFILMSPISISIVYSFSFVPSVMHRVESLLIAMNLKKMIADHCTQHVLIPTRKILEAITTKKCQEGFHLESLELLGDSFLKYAVCQQLFKTFQNQHEGLLTAKKDKIISNAALYALGCDRKLPGFIRNEPFDPKTWMIPGDNSVKYTLNEELLSTSQVIYRKETRKIRGKVVADVVEALIAVFLKTGGEVAALSLLNWLGIEANFSNIPYDRHFPVCPEKLVNVRYLESLLNYSFRDPSLLVEALTHGSYMLPEIPRCYQRLEFLGDSVLDFLITRHFYDKYPELSPGDLTDMRSASVNNELYSIAAAKAGLHRHILHCSQVLHRQIVITLNEFEQLSLASTKGWEIEIQFPKVLADVIESLAGAILVDSGYDTETVFRSMRPLIEPLVTPETVTRNPVRELTELCQKKKFKITKEEVVCGEGLKSITMQVEANGVIYRKQYPNAHKETAKKLACKALLKLIKESMSTQQV